MKAVRGETPLLTPLFYFFFKKDCLKAPKRRIETVFLMKKPMILWKTLDFLSLFLTDMHKKLGGMTRLRRLNGPSFRPIRTPNRKKTH